MIAIGEKASRLPEQAKSQQKRRAGWHFCLDHRDWRDLFEGQLTRRSAKLIVARPRGGTEGQADCRFWRVGVPALTGTGRVVLGPPSRPCWAWCPAPPYDFAARSFPALRQRQQGRHALGVSGQRFAFPFGMIQIVIGDAGIVVPQRCAIVVRAATAMLDPSAAIW